MRRAVLLLLLASACGGGNGTAEPPPAEELVRDGATPAMVRRGDLDGDGVAELVVSSLSQGQGAFEIPTPYIEIFAHREDDWRRVLDGTGHAPPGAGAPGSMLEPADEETALGQTIELLELADLEHDGSSEVVAAISNLGATVGPLELWIVSMSPDVGLRTEYYTKTERGGKVAVTGDRVVLELGVYRKDDPGCCPRILELRTLGYEGGEIRVIERERTRLDRP